MNPFLIGVKSFVRENTINFKNEENSTFKREKMNQN